MGPTIVFENLSFPFRPNGSYDPETNTIAIDPELASNVDKILSGNSRYIVKLMALTAFYMTLIHETGHKANFIDGVTLANGEKKVS